MKTKRIALFAIGTLLVAGVAYQLSSGNHRRPLPAIKSDESRQAGESQLQDRSESMAAEEVPARDAGSAITEEPLAPPAVQVPTAKARQVGIPGAAPAPIAHVADRRSGRIPENSKALPSEEQVSDAKEKKTLSPIGVRLAPDVRLPVAAMPNDLKLSHVAREALQLIVDDYYREVAAVAAGEAEDESLSEQTEDGEITRVIINSPAVDDARKRADNRFKALFGHAAYNRMTINTLLEARSPTVATE